MSDHSESREQVEQGAASAEQILELKDLEPRSEEAEQVRGGDGTVATKQPQAIEIMDYGFGVSMPTTISK